MLLPRDQWDTVKSLHNTAEEQHYGGLSDLLHHHDYHNQECHYNQNWYYDFIAAMVELIRGHWPAALLQLIKFTKMAVIFIFMLIFSVQVIIMATYRMLPDIFCVFIMSLDYAVKLHCFLYIFSWAAVAFVVECVGLELLTVWDCKFIFKLWQNINKNRKIK